MNKKGKQIIVSILLVTLFVSIVGFQIFKEAGAVDDIFSTMYDSDTVFLEEVKDLLQTNLFVAARVDLEPGEAGLEQPTPAPPSPRETKHQPPRLWLIYIIHLAMPGFGM